MSPVKTREAIPLCPNDLSRPAEQLTDQKVPRAVVAAHCHRNRIPPAQGRREIELAVELGSPHGFIAQKPNELPDNSLTCLYHATAPQTEKHKWVYVSGAKE